MEKSLSYLVRASKKGIVLIFPLSFLTLLFSLFIGFSSFSFEDSKRGEVKFENFLLDLNKTQTIPVLSRQQNDDNLSTLAVSSAKQVTKILNMYGERLKKAGKGEYVIDEYSVMMTCKDSYASHLRAKGGEGVAKEFFGSIVKESEKLLVHFDQISVHTVNPGDFIDWYYKKYIDELSRQQEEKRVKEREEGEKRELAFMLFMGALATLIVGLLCVVIVLLHTLKEIQHKGQEG